MNGQLLHFSDEISHLGHILSFNLRDKNDILRATKDPNRKANYILSTFRSVDPCFLIKSFCMAAVSPLLIIQVALNHVIRKIWKLPRQSHTSICHCIAQIPAIRNQIMKRFHSLYKSAVSSPSPVVESVFSSSSFMTFSFTGYNTVYGSKHFKLITILF